MNDESSKRGKIWNVIASARPKNVSLWDAVMQPHVDFYESEVELARYYARYPAQLADELADEYLEFLEHDRVAEIDDWMIYVSLFCHDECWWRLFKSLQPHCPVNFKVFTDFHCAILEQDEGVFLEMRDHDLRRELVVLALWIDAKQLWNDRPSDEEKHAQTQSRGRRRCHFRDHTWLNWYDSGLRPAAIRDKWNSENPDDKINEDTKENGRDTVILGIRKARLERNSGGKS